MRKSGESGARASIHDAHTRVTRKEDKVAAGGDSEIVTRFLDDQRV